MKTIGIIGGMSWESTATYYELLNKGIQTELGGFHSAKMVLTSLDFHEIEQLQHQEKWQEMAVMLGDAARSLEKAGADFFLIATNTMHKIAQEVQHQVSIPLLHIADATGEKLIADGIKKVGLLGTKFTMEQDFYKQRLSSKFHLEVLIPSATQRDKVHDVIYNELCMGKVNDDSLVEYLAFIDELAAHGAEAVILGCTEIAMLVKPEHTTMPLYNTTEIHAKKAIEFALTT